MQVENFKTWFIPWTCLRVIWGHCYLLNGHRDLEFKSSQKNSPPAFTEIELIYNVVLVKRRTMG